MTMLTELGSKEESRPTALWVRGILQEAAMVGWKEGPSPSWGLGAGGSCLPQHVSDSSKDRSRYFMWSNANM